MFYNEIESEKKKSVRISREEIEHAKEIGGKDPLFTLIYKLISDDLMREDFALYMGDIELSQETENRLTDILNKLWKEEVPKILKHMLLYGYCAIYVTLNNGKILLKVPEPDLYDVYIEYDFVEKKPKYRFFWRKDFIEKSEKMEDLQEGFIFPYGLMNPNYREKKGVHGMPSNISYSVYTKNLIERKQSIYVKKTLSEISPYGLEDPNVFLFFGNLGTPDPLSGSICSETRGAFNNFDLIKSMTELFVVKEVQKANPVIFVQPEKRDGDSKKVDPIMVELQSDLVAKEIDQKIDEDNKKKTEQLEVKLNRTNEKIRQINKKSRSLFTDIINTGSHKTLVDLPINTTPHVVNSNDISQDSTLKFIQSIRAEICAQFAIPVHKIIKTFNTKTNVEEIMYKNTIQSRKMGISKIFTEVMKLTALPLIIHDILANNSEDLENDSSIEEDDSENNMVDEVSSSMTNKVGGSEEKIENEDGQGSGVLGDNNNNNNNDDNNNNNNISSDNITDNPLFKMISSVLKRDKINREESEFFIDSTINIDHVLNVLYDSIRIEVNYKIPKQETLDALKEYYNEQIISKYNYISGLLTVYKGDPIIYTVLNEEKTARKDLSTPKEYEWQSSSEEEDEKYQKKPKFRKKKNKEKKKRNHNKDKQKELEEYNEDESVDEDQVRYKNAILKRKYKDSKNIFKLKKTKK